MSVNKTGGIEAGARGAEKHLTAVVSCIADPVFVKDELHRLVFVNDAFCAFTGYGRDAILGRTDECFFSPDEAAEFFRVDDEVLATGITNENLEYLTDAARKKHIIITKKSLFTDPDGARFIVGIIRDVTELETSRQDLAAHLRFVEALISSIAMPVFFKDREGRYLGFNKHFEELTGLSAGEIVGRTAADIFRSDCACVLLAQDAELIEKGGTLVREIVIFHAGMREERSFIITKSVFPDVSGETAGIVGTLLDITEQKRNEEMLRLSEIKYRTIIENTEAIVYTYDLQGVITYISPSVRNFGYEPHEIVGRSFLEFIHEEDATRAVEHFEMSLVDGIDRPITLRVRDRSGEIRVVEEGGKVVRDADGSISHFVGIFRDVTEKRKLEEEVAKTSKLESLGILAGGIAHDFNNILMGIIGNLGLARKRVTGDEKTSEILKRTEAIVHKARKLTEQLITFSRGGAPIKIPLVINDLIRDSAQFALAGANVGCDFDLAKDLWPCDADEGQLAQVVTNLVINAQQSMPAGGTVKIVTRNTTRPREGGDCTRFVHVSVRDQGLGISGEIAGKIFDPFFTTKKGGSGLGLSTSYSIVKNHGGTITVESPPEGGSVFDVFIPASGERRGPGGDVERYAERPARTGRILVMDDDETVLIPLYELLTDGGHEVKVARDGDEAAEIFRRFRKLGKPFDLVITDLVVRGGPGGLDAIRMIRECDASTPVIVSSGYSSDPVMADPHKYGFSGVLSKPYRSEDLAGLMARFFGADGRNSGADAMPANDDPSPARR